MVGPVVEPEQELVDSEVAVSVLILGFAWFFIVLV
jgi:hypothetical protein